MNNLVFVVFDDEGMGFNAVEGNHNLIVVGRNWDELLSEIRIVVKDHFGDDFSGKITIRKFTDEVLYF